MSNFDVPGHGFCFQSCLSFNPIQTGLFWTFWDQGGGALEAPLCNFKTVNAMVTKLTQDDVHNNSSSFRCSDVIIMSYDVIHDVIYQILSAEKMFNQYFHSNSIYNHKLLARTCLRSLLCLTIGWLSLATLMTSLWQPPSWVRHLGSAILNFFKFVYFITYPNNWSF